MYSAPQKQFMNYGFGLTWRLMIFLKASGSLVVTADSVRRFHCLAVFGKNECRWKSLLERGVLKEAELSRWPGCCDGVR